jgi:peptidoglycan/LPS O-acetylase OafA/YrhL
MLGGFFGVEDIDGVYWTLYLELKFYALIFAVLLFNKIERIEWVMSTWIFILLINFISPLPELVSFFVFPEWAPYFIGGASFYLLKMKGANLLRITNLFIAFYLSLYMAAEGVVELNTVYHAVASPIVAIITIFLFYIIFALIIFDKLSWFRSKYAMSIGALTYPLYLMHQNIGYITFNHFYKDMNKYLLLSAVIGILLVVSWLISAKIEKKLGPYIKQSLNKLLNKYGNSTPATAR